MLSEAVSKQRCKRFDSVRGVFVEGGELYPGSCFNAKNHIQVCVRSDACIKGYFRVREESDTGAQTS